MIGLHDVCDDLSHLQLCQKRANFEGQKLTFWNTYMKAVTVALLTLLMMGLSTVHACEDHEGVIKGKTISTPLPPPNSN